MNANEALELCKRLRRGDKIELGEAIALVNYIPALFQRAEAAEERLAAIQKIPNEAAPCAT